MLSASPLVVCIREIRVGAGGRKSDIELQVEFEDKEGR